MKDCDNSTRKIHINSNFSVLKSGSLNLLEHSGPVQVCNEIALPLPLLISIRDCVESKAIVRPEGLCQ